MPLPQVMTRPLKLLQDSSKTLCRALGLNVIFSFFVFLRHKMVGKGYTEPTKIAIRRSRTTALLRTLIHVIPVGVALWEIVLNWNTYFVGYAIYNQAYYQFGAKAHEIAIEASLSAVIFSTNASEVPLQCLNASISEIYTYACPFHGWEAIQDYIYTGYNVLDPEYLASFGVLNPPNWVDVTGHGSQRRLLIGADYGQPEGYDPIPIMATTQQSVVADTLTETGDLWVNAVSNITTSGHGSVLQREDTVHTISSGYLQPYTMASCANDVIRGPQDDTAVAFPLPPAVEPSLMLNQAKYNDSILDIYSFVYPDPFNGSAIGAVILLPRSTTNLTQEILLCTLGAGWGSTLINTSSYAGGVTFTTSLVDLSAIPNQTPFNESSPNFNELSQAESAAGDSVCNYYLPYFPEKPVIVTEAWANYMNPFIPALNTTVIDALMSTNQPVEELLSQNQIVVAKWALAGLLANGLASIGATGTLQGNIKTVMKPDGSSELDGNYWFSGKGNVFTVDPEESKDWVKLRVDSTINGYAYNIRGASPKVAISFLLVYCIIALSHVLYAGISGISSTCWDSIGEVTALAINSTPTTLLKNTCAGITELNIFKLPVRVFAIRDSEGDGEHLELVFGNVDEKNVKGTPIKPNRVYGTLPKMVKEEKIE
ncbi:MAG: hypothetical protein ASARMPRED_008282 [Alectoria sarmentosa]|nr:MAG: hypothetical protein ASARMPRED_008282 [Alectoria sarmentosa]